MSKIQSALDLTIAFKFNGVTVEIVKKELKKEKNLWLICFCLCVVEGERVGGGGWGDPSVRGSVSYEPKYFFQSPGVGISAIT